MNEIEVIARLLYSRTNVSIIRHDNLIAETSPNPDPIYIILLSKEITSINKGDNLFIEIRKDYFVYGQVVTNPISSSWFMFEAIEQ